MIMRFVFAVPEGQYTFAMVKPDAMDQLNHVLTDIVKTGFEIVWGSVLYMSKEMAEEFYAEHKGKPFYEKLIIHMSYKYVFVMIIKNDKSEDIITEFRTVVGNTDPQQADQYALRATYGTIMPANALHASDSDKSAYREVKLIHKWLKQ